MRMRIGAWMALVVVGLIASCAADDGAPSAPTVDGGSADGRGPSSDATPRSVDSSTSDGSSVADASVDGDASVDAPVDGGDAGGEAEAGIVYAGNHLWSKLIGGPSSNLTTSVPMVVAGSGGAIFLTDTFTGTLDLGGGPLNGTTYLARWDTNGQHVWSKGFADAEVGAIAVDASGLYVTGWFRNSIDFGGGGTLAAAAGTDRNTFLAKLDLNGNHVWSKRLANTWVQVPSLTTVGTDVVWVARASGGEWNFGGGPQAGNATLAVRLVGATGALKWTRRGVGSGFGPAPGVVADSAGNIVIGGGLHTRVNWGTGPVESVAGSKDIYLVKFDPTGNLVWDRKFGASANEEVQGVAVNAGGELFVTGLAWGNGAGTSVDFGNGVVASSAYPTSPMARAPFLAKLTPNGDPVWAKVYGTNGPSIGAIAESITMDKGGNIVVSGSSECGLDFGGGALPEAPNAVGFFLVKLDAAGNHMWSKGWTDRGGIPGAGRTFVNVDFDGNTLVSAPIKNVGVDMGGGPLTAGDWWARVVAKLGP